MPRPHTSKKAPAASLLAAKDDGTTLRQLQNVSCAASNLERHDLAVAQIGSATSASGRSVVWFDWKFHHRACSRPFSKNMLDRPDGRINGMGVRLRSNVALNAASSSRSQMLTTRPKDDRRAGGRNRDIADRQADPSSLPKCESFRPELSEWSWR